MTATPAPCPPAVSLLRLIAEDEAEGRDDPALRDAWTAHIVRGCVACKRHWLEVVSVRLAAGQGVRAAWNPWNTSPSPEEVADYRAGMKRCALGEHAPEVIDGGAILCMDGGTPADRARLRREGLCFCRYCGCDLPTPTRTP